MNNKNNLTRAATWVEKLLHAIFDPEFERDFRFLGFIGFCLIFLVGITWWAAFFNFGKTHLDYGDWDLINIPRLVFLQQAIQQHVFPWHMTYTPPLHETDRFFSLPDVISSPQVLLLAFIKVRHFVYLDFLFHYTLAACGIFLIKKQLNLSLAAVCFLFFLLNFNGYLIAHFAVGHFTWVSHFLFPLFFALMISFANGAKGWLWVTATAFLLFYMVLVGGEHQFVWLLLFMILMLPAFWRRSGWLLAAMLFAGLLASVRLLPPVVELERFSWVSTALPAGYPSINNLAQAMIRLVSPENVSEPLYKFGYWELNLFVGLVGLGFIIYFGLVRWAKNLDIPPNYSGFILPVFGMILFSLSDTFRFVKLIPFPLFQGERVSSRIIDVPFVFLLIIAAYYFQNFLSERERKSPFYIVVTGLFLWMAHDLWANLKLWSVDSWATISNHALLNYYEMNLVGNHPDSVYFSVFYLGAAVTVISAVILICLCLRELRRYRRSVDEMKEIN